MPLYSSSTVKAARQTHTHRERKGRKGDREKKENVENFSLITPTSSRRDDDDINDI